jgi:hypothetical protein
LFQVTAEFFHKLLIFLCRQHGTVTAAALISSIFKSPPVEGREHTGKAAGVFAAAGTETVSGSVRSRTEHVSALGEFSAGGAAELCRQTASGAERSVFSRVGQMARSLAAMGTDFHFGMEQRADEKQQQNK